MSHQRSSVGPDRAFDPAEIDRLIGAASSTDDDEGIAHLAGKLDHLLHALRMSGRLEQLSSEQVVNIAYALRASGHTQVPPLEYLTYNQDGLASSHNSDFLNDPRFVAAYARGIQAAGSDYGWPWRVHVALWAASCAVRLDGDFVECGVNRGFMSSAIMQYLDWNRLDRRFILMDTFKGLDAAFISDEERAQGKTEAFFGYTECYEDACRNFAEFANVELIRGSIPTTLPLARTSAVCFLHLDMNCVIPEVAAVTHFWDRIVPGGVVLLDDYGFRSLEPQKRGMDAFAAERGVSILSLPTGQGLFLKS